MLKASYQGHISSSFFRCMVLHAFTNFCRFRLVSFHVPRLPLLFIFFLPSSFLNFHCRCLYYFVSHIPCLNCVPFSFSLPKKLMDFVVIDKVVCLLTYL